MTGLRFLLFGAHGKVAQHFTRHALNKGHTIYAVLRNPDHVVDLPQPPTPAALQPVVLSLEQASVSELSSVISQHKPNVIIFSAGAGGKGGPERTRAVDLEGALKVFDAIEQSKIATSLAGEDAFRRFIMVSAIDTRDVEKTKPDWYTEEDYERSKATRAAIGFYSQMKYEADRDLSKRTAFPWFVLRPGRLTDEPGRNQVMLGERKTITVPITRDDVGKALLTVAEQPKGSKIDGLMLDLTNGGDKDIETAVKEAAARGRTDWLE